jgi:DNA (cytosine-5)-methyltransferase 1
MHINRFSCYMTPKKGCGTHMTLDQSQMTIFDLLEESEDKYTLSREGFLAKASQSLESVKDLQTLLAELIRFASILRPQYLLLENVTGLLNHDEGRTFETVIGTLDELGYVGEWCVLNSAAYVPQNRERVFIVASLGGRSGRKIFPFGAENANAIEVIGKLNCGYNDQNSRVYSPAGIAPTLPTMQGGGQEPKVMVLGNTNPSGNGMNGQVYDSEGLAPTLTTNKGEGVKVLQRNFSGQYSTYEGHTGTLQASRVDKIPMIVQRPRGNNKGGFHEIAPTLTSNSYQDNNHVVKGYRIRKLTPLECFRLQSFPDWWYYKLKEHGISDSQLYKMAGNAVTSRVAYEIAKRLSPAA